MKTNPTYCRLDGGLTRSPAGSIYTPGGSCAGRPLPVTPVYNPAQGFGYVRPQAGTYVPVYWPLFYTERVTP